MATGKKKPQKQEEKKKTPEVKYYVAEYNAGDVETFDTLRLANEYIKNTCQETGADAENFTVIKGIELEYEVHTLSYPEFSE